MHAPQNEITAAQNRERLTAAGVVFISLSGVAGSGRSSLTRALAPYLARRLRLAVVLTRRAQCVEQALLGAPGVISLAVNEELTSAGLNTALDQVQLRELDMIIAVGAVAPNRSAVPDLGEHARVLTLNCAAFDGPVDGTWRAEPLLVIVTKSDLLPLCDCLPISSCAFETALRQLRHLNPTADVIYTSARNGIGLENVAQWLLARLWSSGCRTAAAHTSRRLPLGGRDKALGMRAGLDRQRA